MALEDLTGSRTIDSLVTTNPNGATDSRRFGFAHLQGIKNVIKNTFPNIDGAVTLTPTQFNAAIQLVSGTAMMFSGPSVPTGWTQDTSVPDYMLRIVNTAGGGTGGTSDFFTDLSNTTVAGHSLTVAEMPAHSHAYSRYLSLVNGVVSGAGSNTVLDGTSAISTNGKGNGASHDHTIDFTPLYRDMVLATKD